MLPLSERPLPPEGAAPAGGAAAGSEDGAAARPRRGPGRILVGTEGERTVRPGNRSGDRAVRIVRPRLHGLRPAAPGYVRVEEEPAARGHLDRSWRRVKRAPIGRPISSALESHERRSFGDPMETSARRPQDAHPDAGGARHPQPGSSLEAAEDDYARVEEAFQQALDGSLQPRGPESLFDVLASLDPPPAGVAVDVGCGEGRDAIELARRFGLRVHGVDPVPHYVERAAAAAAAGVGSSVAFRVGRPPSPRPGDRPNASSSPDAGAAPAIGEPSGAVARPNR